MCVKTCPDVLRSRLFVILKMLPESNCACSADLQRSTEKQGALSLCCCKEEKRDDLSALACTPLRAHERCLCPAQPQQSLPPFHQSKYPASSRVGRCEVMREDELLASSLHPNTHVCPAVLPNGLHACPHATHTEHWSNPFACLFSVLKQKGSSHTCKLRLQMLE